MKQIGIALLILGLGMTVVTEFKFFTKEKVVDIGNLEINREKPHYLSWAPVLGIVIMGVGGLILYKGSRK